MFDLDHSTTFLILSTLALILSICTIAYIITYIVTQEDFNKTELFFFWYTLTGVTFFSTFLLGISILTLIEQPSINYSALIFNFMASFIFYLIGGSIWLVVFIIFWPLVIIGFYFYILQLLLFEYLYPESFEHVNIIRFIIFEIFLAVVPIFSFLAIILYMKREKAIWDSILESSKDTGRTLKVVINKTIENEKVQ
ncbi:MAG: hypothetical protein ACFE95_02270 [Candidatus Hodarchaeota archaeon]